jgi:hypothetical protein
MRLEDTMVGLSLAPKSRGARIRECVYVGLVGGSFMHSCLNRLTNSRRCF